MVGIATMVSIVELVPMESTLASNKEVLAIIVNKNAADIILAKWAKLIENSTIAIGKEAMRSIEYPSISETSIALSAISMLTPAR